jgi:hypothetical protein
VTGARQPAERAIGRRELSDEIVLVFDGGRQRRRDERPVPALSSAEVATLRESKLAGVHYIPFTE